MAKEQEQRERREKEGAGEGEDGALRCAACGHRITEEAYRIERAEKHEHTFVNPGGVVHHIGCFAAAPGCAYAGGLETAFSWFPGWSWQIAVCARCRAHVGWRFLCSDQQFHGLVLAALRR